MLQLVSTHASGRDLIVEFVRNKAVERQYHTYFNWDRGNANAFFALFGEGFKGHMERRVKQEEAYDRAIKAFLELGSERNRLVHQDFGSYVLEKTVDEIMDTFHRARPFVDSLLVEFAAYAAQRATD